MQTSTAYSDKDQKRVLLVVNDLTKPIHTVDDTLWPWKANIFYSLRVEYDTPSRRQPYRLRRGLVD